MDINDIEHPAVERIFLIPDASEGQLGYVWCDDPAPGEGMDASEAVEYVRKDVHDAAIAELERERDMHKAAEEAQIALRRKADELNVEQAASLERIVDAWMYDDTGIHDRYAYGVMLPVTRYEGVNQAIMESRLKGVSLKRRDLIQRALELEALSLKMNKDWEGNDCIWPETLTDRYNELRKQGEA